MKDYTEIWHIKDAIQTVVEANGFSVWDCRQISPSQILLELSSHLSDEAIEKLSCQFSLTTDYEGEGPQGTLFNLYLE